ncbi:DUF697 domain-containing protein [Acetobacterium wieringae]|uniref:DUF697 domain-containing protein n=1 Tax=Acetobacterium wieringae TaxID=52694 RepID=A0A5D0WS99_9FIRM|nr:DUF697 domain-containing protein [Acetobacterium wieringae]TYC87115.1 DUF697 domain-containing protein [Acetobacterium wieringae]
MERGNVLVIGNPEVGIKTLIRAVFGEESVETGWGPIDDIDELDIYESEIIPLRIIDAVCYKPSFVIEPPFIKEQRVINSVKKWSNSRYKEGHKDNQINLIWLCVDGTMGKEFTETLKNLLRLTPAWESVPIVVVITKSYSVGEREKNIEMANNVFADQKKSSKNLRKIIPVVAATYSLNERAFAPPEGISELIDVTNELMPEGTRAADKAVSTLVLNQKRTMAHSLVGLSTAAAVTVCAVPFSLADGVLLIPLEIAEIKGLAKIYGIKDDENSKQFFNTIVEVGAVTIAAKAAIGALKLIPGINLATSVINAIVGGAIVAAIGEGSIFVYEKIYLGEKSVADIEWVKNVMEATLTSQFMEKVTLIVEKITKLDNPKDIGKILPDILTDVFSHSDSKNPSTKESL